MPSGPVTHSDQDELEHNTHAKILARLIEEVIARNAEIKDKSKGERKNTLSLLAGFGVGKSTIYWLLNNLLGGHQKIELVRVGAWRHAATDLRVSMLRRIFELLECRKRGCDFEDLTPDQLKEINRAFEERVYCSQSLQVTDHEAVSITNLMGEMQAALKGIGVDAFLFLLIAGGLFTASQLVASWLTTVPFWTKLLIQLSPGTIGTSIYAYFIFPRIRENFGIINRPPIRTTSRPNPASTSPEQLEILFHHLVREWLSSTKKYPVFFIDDIDRQAPDQIIQSLDALRTFIEVGHCVFVVACDESKVKNAIAIARNLEVSENQPGPTEFDDYVQRYFPHPYRLPQFEPRDMRAFVRKAVANHANKHLLQHLSEKHEFPLTEVTEILIHEGVTTPRQAIRLLDEFCNSLLAAAEMERTARLNAGTVTSNPLFLARLVVIRLDFDWVLGHLKKNPDLLNWLSTLEREGSTALEDHALNSCAFFYPQNIEGANRWAQPLPKFEKLLRFVTHTARYDAASALPFLYLNEFGDSGAWSDEFRREIYGLLSAGQVVQLKNRLVDTTGDTQKERIADIFCDVLINERIEPTARQNAVESVPKVFSLVHPAKLDTVADAWASAAVRTANAAAVKKVEITFALPILNRISRIQALRVLLPNAIDLGEANDDAKLDRVEAALSYVPLLKRAGMFDKVQQYIATPLSTEAEKSALIEWCRRLKDLTDEQLPEIELFGRGFSKRITSFVGSADSAEFADATEFIDQLSSGLNKAWQSLSESDRLATAKELLETPQGLHLAMTILPQKWQSLGDAGAAEIAEILCKVANTAANTDCHNDAIGLITTILELRPKIQTASLMASIDEALAKHVIRTEIALSENLEAIDRVIVISGVTSLPQTHDELCDLLKRFIAAKRTDPIDSSIETNFKYLLGHLDRLSAASREKLVKILAHPLEEAGHSYAKEAAKWLANTLSTPELNTLGVGALDGLAKSLGSATPWESQSQKAAFVVDNKNSLSADAVSFACKSISTYAATNHGQKNWLVGAFETLASLSARAPDEDRVVVARQLLTSWNNFGHPAWISAAKVLQVIRNSVSSAGLDNDYRAKMLALITTHSDAWATYSVEWKIAPLAHQLQIFSAMHLTPEKIVAFYQYLDRPALEIETEQNAELLIQIARKHPANFERFAEVVASSMNLAALEKLGSTTFRKLRESFTIGTDAPVVRFAAKWCSHPNREGDSFMTSLAGGKTPERNLLAMAFNDYSSESGDSSFTDTVVRALASELAPSTDQGILLNIANSLRAAGLSSHESVLAQRDGLKQMRDGDDDQKKRWEELRSILPPKSRVVEAASGIIDALGFGRGPDSP